MLDSAYQQADQRVLKCLRCSPHKIQSWYVVSQDFRLNLCRAMELYTCIRYKRTSQLPLPHGPRTLNKKVHMWSSSDITLFSSKTMLCGSDSILWIFHHSGLMWGIFRKTLFWFWIMLWNNSISGPFLYYLGPARIQSIDHILWHHIRRSSNQGFYHLLELPFCNI